jgi:hypothetical protein
MIKIGNKDREIPTHFFEIYEIPEGDQDIMSVIASQRGITKMKFYHQARIIRRDIISSGCCLHEPRREFVSSNSEVYCEVHSCSEIS